MIATRSADVAATAERLVAEGKAVMIVMDWVGDRRTIPTIVPVGYVYPYGDRAEWYKTI